MKYLLSQNATFAREKCAKHNFNERNVGAIEASDLRIGHSDCGELGKSAHRQHFTSLCENCVIWIGSRAAEFELRKSVNSTESFLIGNSLILVFFQNKHKVYQFAGSNDSFILSGHSAWFAYFLSVLFQSKHVQRQMARERHLVTNSTNKADLHRTNVKGCLSVNDERILQQN